MVFVPTAAWRSVLFGVVLMLVGVLSPVRSYATWELVAQFDQPVTAAHFWDEYNGIVCLSTTFGNIYGKILVTTDGGKTWRTATIPQNSGNNHFSSIHMISRSEGWLSYYTSQLGTNIWHTLDGGLTWQPTNMRGDYASVWKTSKALIATSYTDGAVISTDNGTTFRPAPGAPTSTVGLHFNDDLHGVMAGFGGFTYYTTDGGLTWQLANCESVESWGVYGIQNSGTFLMAPEVQDFSTSQNIVYRSTDYGANWNQVAILPFIPTGGIVGRGKVAFIQATVDNPGMQGLFRTTDAGETWKSIGGPSFTYDTRIVLTGCEGILYAFDATGGVYRSKDGGDGEIPVELAAPEIALDVQSISLTMDECTSLATLDTFIVVHNTACGLLKLTERTFSSGDGSFTDTTTRVLPYLTDTLHLRFFAPKKSATTTLTLKTNDPVRPEITIPVNITVPIKDTLTFQLTLTPSHAPAGDTIAVSLSASDTLLLTNTKPVSIALDYYGDLFDYLDVTTSLPRTSVTGVIQTRDDKLDILSCVLTSDSTLVVEPGKPFLTLHLAVRLTDSSSSLIHLNQTGVEGFDPTHTACAFVVSSNAPLFTLDKRCADSTIQHFMQGKSVLDLLSVVPNPLTVQSGYHTTIRFRTSGKLPVTLTLKNALGQTVEHQLFPFTLDGEHTYELDASTLPPGCYFLTLQAQGASAERMIVVMK